MALQGIQAKLNNVAFKANEQKENNQKSTLGYTAAGAIGGAALGSALPYAGVGQKPALSAGELTSDKLEKLIEANKQNDEFVKAAEGQVEKLKQAGEARRTEIKGVIKNENLTRAKEATLQVTTGEKKITVSAPGRVTVDGKDRPVARAVELTGDVKTKVTEVISNAKKEYTKVQGEVFEAIKDKMPKVKQHGKMAAIGAAVGAVLLGGYALVTGNKSQKA